MAFRVGQTVGGYRFLRVLDSDGPAMIYEVENEVAGRREILKLLPRGFEEDRDRVDRFLREAKIHSRLSHPNIAEFYSGIQLDGQLVMTMEAVPGVTLEQRIADGSVSTAESIEIARQTLSALDYAHVQQVVHREITPATIRITPEGVVKLAGLGLAKQEQDPALTQIGTAVGAVHYMSPEQVKGQSDIDGRADIYPLGIVLYEAVTGQKPFDSQSQYDIIQAQVMQAPKPPSEISEKVSEQLSRGILKALEKDRDNRYQTASGFLAPLDQLETSMAPGRAIKRSHDGVPVGMRQLAQSLEFNRGPAPAAQPTPVLHTGKAADSNSGPEPSRRKLPAWTAAGPAALEDLKVSSKPEDAESVASLWGLEGWAKQDLTVISLLAFVMSAAAVVALMVWLGL